MTLQTAYEKYYNYLKKGIEDGLTHEDYLGILKLSSTPFENDMYKKFWVALMGDINYLLEDLRMDGKIVSEVDPVCMEYILENCYLLPLVLANKKEKYVKPYQEGSYLFMCQFHDDEYPALEVTDYNNQYKCFVCGEQGDILSYIKKMEKIRKEKVVVDLIRRIYNLDELYLSSNMNEIALKYRKTILSDQYKRLLEKGYTLFKSNNLVSIDGHFIDKMYEDRFFAIHRIENGEKDKWFEYKRNDTYRLKLSMEEYKPFLDKVSKKI